jgi:membrane associated rhomboid family serine protease
MLLPLRTDIPLRARPWMNYAIILVTIALSVWGWKYPTLAEHYELNARDPHLVNFLSYAFLHQPGALAPWLSIHLIGNVLALYLFGNNVNDRLGHVGYLALYLAGAVFAAVGCVLLPGSGPRVIGASGAVMAVTGGYLVLFPRSHMTLMYVLIVINGVVEVPCLYLVSFFVALDVAMNLAGSTGVAHTAHVWGALLGFGVCMILLATRLLPRDPFDFLALVQRWHRRRQYQSLVAAGFDPFGGVGGGARPAAGGGVTVRRADQPAGAAVAVGGEVGGRRADDAYNAALERIKELRAQVHEAIAHHNLPHAAILFIELKTLDPDQVLSRQAQLDVANQLASQQFFREAADAYEQFIRHYPNFKQLEHVELMAGLIYARYLGRKARAKELLSHAVTRLHDERQIAMAREELEKLGVPQRSA